MYINNIVKIKRLQCASKIQNMNTVNNLYNCISNVVIHVMYTCK
jgi:hypothetical protein